MSINNQQLSTSSSSLANMLKKYTNEELKQEIIDANYMQLEAIERLCIFLEFVYNQQHKDVQGTDRKSPQLLKEVLHNEYVQYTVYNNTVTEPRTVLTRLNNFYRLIAQQYKQDETGLQHALVDLISSTFRYTIDLYLATYNQADLKRRTEKYNDLFSAKQLVEFITVVFPKIINSSVDHQFVSTILRLGLKLGLSFETVWMCLEDQLTEIENSSIPNSNSSSNSIISNSFAFTNKETLYQEFIKIAYSLLNVNPSVQLISTEQILDLLKSQEMRIKKLAKTDKLVAELELDHLQSARAASLVLLDYLRHKA